MICWNFKLAIKTRRNIGLTVPKMFSEVGAGVVNGRYVVTRQILCPESAPEIRHREAACRRPSLKTLYRPIIRDCIHGQRQRKRLYQSATLRGALIRQSHL